VAAIWDGYWEVIHLGSSTPTTPTDRATPSARQQFTTIIVGVAGGLSSGFWTFGIQLVAGARRRLFTCVADVEFRMTSLCLHHI
jgi:hypothetical protein